MSKRCLVITVIILCSGGIIAFSSLYLTRFLGKSGARISFDSLEYDFDKAGYDEKKSLSLEFKNTGNEVLYVNRVSADCKCVVGELQKKTYAPDETGSLQIQFSARGSPGEKISHVVHVHSNDAKQPVVEVVIKGEMQPSLRIVPREINLGTVRIGDAPNTCVTVASFGEKEKFDIISASTTLEDAEVTVSNLAGTARVGLSDELRHFPKNRAAYQVFINLPVQSSKGPIEEFLTIRTTSDLSPKITVSIRGNVKSSLRLDPPFLFFQGSDTEVPMKKLKISSKYPFVLKLPNDSFINCTTAENGSSNVWIISCSLRKGTLLRSHKGILNFVVNEHPYESSLQVPYSVLIQKM